MLREDPHPLISVALKSQLLSHAPRGTKIRADLPADVAAACVGVLVAHVVADTHAQAGRGSDSAHYVPPHPLLHTLICLPSALSPNVPRCGPGSSPCDLSSTGLLIWHPKCIFMPSPACADEFYTLLFPRYLFLFCNFARTIGRFDVTAIPGVIFRVSQVY